VTRVNVSVTASPTTATNGYWQHYPSGDPEGYRLVALEILDAPGGWRDPLTIRGRMEDVRAFVDALVRTVELLDLSGPGERVGAVSEATDGAVDP
jgi:hypothetical protein